MKKARLSENGRIKILMVGSALSVKGGMTSVVTQLLGHDWEQAVEIRYIPTHASGSAVKKCVVFLGGYLKLLYFLLFRRSQVDIVHMHMSYKGSFYRKYLIHRLVKKLGKKDLVHLHGSEFGEFYETANDKLKTKIRRLLRECDRVLVLGGYWEKTIRDIEPQAGVSVLRNAVSIPGARAQWDGQERRILYLGVLIERKGIADLLQAMGILNGDAGLKGRLKLTIAGTGEQEAALRRICADLDLEEAVSFFGWADSAAKKTLLESSQCLVLPSYHEGLPVAVLEAMSYGLPVIATDVGSIGDAVLDGENGRLVPVHSPEQLADAVRQVLGDPAVWQSMSDAARQTVAERFDERQFFAQLQRIYRAVRNGEWDL